MPLISRILYPTQWKFAHIREFDYYLAIRHFGFKSMIKLLSIPACLSALCGLTLKAIHHWNLWSAEPMDMPEPPAPITTLVTNCLFDVVDGAFSRTDCYLEYITIPFDIPEVEIDTTMLDKGQKYLDIALILFLMTGFIGFIYGIWCLFLPSYTRTVRDCLAYQWRFNPENPKPLTTPDAHRIQWYDESIPYERWVLEEDMKPDDRRVRRVKGKLINSDPLNKSIEEDYPASVRYHAIPLLNEE